MIVNLTTFTLIHIGLSLVGIVAGLVVAGGLAAGKRLDGWTGYGKRLAGAWRSGCVVGALLALCLNVFVLLAQPFRRLPALSAAAPTQTEPPFLVTQFLVLALFVWLGRTAVTGFRATAPARVG